MNALYIGSEMGLTSLKSRSHGLRGYSFAFPLN